MTIAGTNTDELITRLIELTNIFTANFVLGVVVAAVLIFYRPANRIFRRHDYSIDPDEFRMFDEQAALEEWKRKHGQDS